MSSSQAALPSSASAGLLQVWNALALTGQDYEYDPGVDRRGTADVEESLGRRLPADLAAIYEAANGLYLLHGNLQILPITAEEENWCLPRHTDWLRSVEWTIPDEVVVFGGNGGDEVFGLWIPRGSDPEKAPVVLISDEDFTDDPGYGLIGSTFTRFFASWTAMYLIITEANEAALEALGVPNDIQEDDEEILDRIIAWGDPTLAGDCHDPNAEGAIPVSVLRSRFAR